MNAAGLAPGTIKTRYVNVRSVFRAAVRDRVIGSDPTDLVRLPRSRRADVAMSIPAPEEVGQLMTMADDRFQPFIALCAFAGLRLGEAAGVQLGDIDFLRKSLKVSRQVQRVNGGAIDVRAPKYGSERVVYLADSLVTVLAKHVAAHGTTGDDRWLFAGDGDGPPRDNAEVVVAAHRFRKQLHVTVADNCTGLPAGFRADAGGRLGLQIVRALATGELRGSIELRNRAGGGTEAVLVVPLGKR